MRQRPTPRFHSYRVPGECALQVLGGPQNVGLGRECTCTGSGVCVASLPDAGLGLSCSVPHPSSDCACVSLILGGHGLRLCMGTWGWWPCDMPGAGGGCRMGGSRSSRKEHWGTGTEGCCRKGNSRPRRKPPTEVGNIQRGAEFERETAQWEQERQDGQRLLLICEIQIQHAGPRLPRLCLQGGPTHIFSRPRARR